MWHFAENSAKCHIAGCWFRYLVPMREARWKTGTRDPQLFSTQDQRLHHNVLVAQLDRALDYGSEGWKFESFQAQFYNLVMFLLLCLNVRFLSSNALRALENVKHRNLIKNYVEHAKIKFQHAERVETTCKVTSSVALGKWDYILQSSFGYFPLILNKENNLCILL